MIKLIESTSKSCRFMNSITYPSCLIWELRVMYMHPKGEWLKPGAGAGVGVSA